MRNRLSLLGCGIALWSLPPTITSCSPSRSNRSPDASCQCDGAPDDDSSPIDGLCSELPRAICSYRVRCGMAQSVDSCEAVLAKWEALGDCFGAQKESLAAGRLTYGEAHAAGCVDAMTDGAACPGDDPFALLPECQGLFAGQVAAGGDCSIDDDCGADAFCSTDACPGTCLARAAAGEPAARDRECQAGLYAYQGDCREPAGADASCASIGDGPLQRCTQGTYCNPDGYRCEAVRGVGEPCPTGLECGPLLQCTVYGCEAWKRSGAPCTRALSSGAPSDGRLCVDDLFCDTPPNNLPGACAERRSDGGPCFDSGDCQPGLLCWGATENGTGACKAPPADGEPCYPFSDDSCRQDSFCPLNDEAVCTPRRAEGQACPDGAGRECRAGLVCVDQICTVPWCRVE